MSKKIFTRNSDGAATVRRDKDSGKVFIDFYPSVFNQKSKLIREWGEVFYEKIAPGAFDNVLTDPGLNTIHTVDHFRHKMLGRLKSGTLQLSTDKKGLKATIEMPDTSLGRDMVVMIERGDYFECSFIFTIAEKGVTYDRSEDIPVRTVTEVADLIDTSFVIDGAYANTEISKRAQFEGWEISPKQTETEQTQNQTEEATRAAAQHDILSKEIEILNLQ